MSAFQIFTQPSQQALDTAANVLSGATLTFTLTGTSTPVNAYLNPDLVTNPVTGVTADAAGVFAPVYFDPLVVYRAVLKTQAGAVLKTWDPANENIIGYFTQAVIGGLLYPHTGAEIAASATPVNYAYVPGHVYRYGTNTTPGTTDMQSAITTAIAVGAQGVEVLIPPEVLAHSGTLAWGFANLRVRCLGNATLKHTGTGVANSIDAGVSASLFNICIGSGGYLQELGNSNTTIGWYLRALGRCDINIRAKNATTVGIEVDFAVLCMFRFGITNNDGISYTTQPPLGIVLTSRGASEPVSYCSFPGLFAENLSATNSIGVVLSACLGCHFPNGSAEGCDIGLKVNGSPNNLNTFYDWDLESNLTRDALVTGGTNCRFINLNSQSTTPGTNILVSGGDSASFIGGFLRAVDDTGASNTLYIGCQVIDAVGDGILGSGSRKALGIVPVDTNRAPTGTVFHDIIGVNSIVFTPGIKGGTTAGTQTYSTQLGYYTRVGKQVSFTIYLVLTGNSGGTGNAIITGLPFVASSNIDQAFAIVDWSGVTLGTAGDSLAMRIPIGLSTGVIVETGTTNALIAIGAIGTTAQIRVSGTYQIA